MKKRILICVAAMLLSSCFGNVKVSQGQQLINEGRLDQGLAMLEEAARQIPRDTEAYNTWITQRDSVVRGLTREGDIERNRGNLEVAESQYRRALGFDPTFIPAQNGVQIIERERRLQKLTVAAAEAFRKDDLDAAERDTRAVLKESPNNRDARALMRSIAEARAKADTLPPQLKQAMNKPITLEFRDAPLRSIFEVISRSSGINFVFDRDVRQDLRATIYMQNTHLDDVIRILLSTNQLDRKILNENSILIYPNTPAKQKDYQELAVRSFYLANADVKQTAAMIRALVKTRDIYIDEKLNLLVMKDTPQAIRIAEQLVATQDLGEPEVVLELEVLEVASSLIRNFGVQYPDAVNVGIIPGATTSANVVTTFTEVKPKDWDFFVINPAIKINLLQNDGAVNTLANPRIRVKNREKAKIHIGEKVPVITSTSTANVGVSSSVSYLEVGLKLDVEPNVHLDDEVAMKVQLEVSNILQEVRFQDTISYRLGTRNATTTLRLRDGETQMLAGLINDEDRRTASKLPYLGDLPLLGKLFGTSGTQNSKSEIVLLITPHIVRNLQRPDTVQPQFPSGTDSAPGAAPLRLSHTAPRSLGISASGGASAPAQAKPTPAEASNDVALAMSGPDVAAIGEEFVLSFGLPMRLDGAQSRLQLNYDPKILALVSGATGTGGNATVDISASSIAGTPSPVSQVRFRVIAAAPTRTSIGIENLRSTDNAQRPLTLSVPGTHSLSITGTTAGAANPQVAPQ